MPTRPSLLSPETRGYQLLSPAPSTHRLKLPGSDAQLNPGCGPAVPTAYGWLWSKEESRVDRAAGTDGPWTHRSTSPWSTGSRCVWMPSPKRESQSRASSAPLHEWQAVTQRFSWPPLEVTHGVLKRNIRGKSAGVSTMLAFRNARERWRGGLLPWVLMSSNQW